MGSRGGGHWRGRIVVLAIFAMGLVLGIVALAFRGSMPKRPATQPTTSVSLPGR